MAHNATHVPFRELVPNLCCESWTKFGGYTAEIPDRLHVHSNGGREQNSAMHHIRGNAQWRGDRFMCARKGGYEDLTKEILRHFEAYGFLNPVIIQCDKEMSIIDVCRKVARERNARTVLRFAPKTKSSEQRVCRSSVRTDTGLARCYQTQIETSTHWYTAFSNFICLSICNSLRWICALKIDSATRRQNPIPIFARNSICVTFVHVW